MPFSIQPFACQPLGSPAPLFSTPLVLYGRHILATDLASLSLEAFPPSLFPVRLPERLPLTPFKHDPRLTPSRELSSSAFDLPHSLALLLALLITNSLMYLLLLDLPA